MVEISQTILERLGALGVANFTFDPPPVQAAFTEDDIRGMDVGRRQLKTEWQNALHSPSQPDKNWSIVLPFANTYENAFGSMCETNSHLYHGKDDRLIIFLNGTEGEAEGPAEAVEVGRKGRAPGRDEGLLGHFLRA